MEIDSCYHIWKMSGISKSTNFPDIFQTGFLNPDYFQTFQTFPDFPLIPDIFGRRGNPVLSLRCCGLGTDVAYSEVEINRVKLYDNVFSRILRETGCECSPSKTVRGACGRLKTDRTSDKCNDST